VIVGILLLGEPATPLRLLCVAAIIAGVAGLKLLAES
jgi:quaternary ammonium compound-resistance protein SugE